MENPSTSKGQNASDTVPEKNVAPSEPAGQKQSRGKIPKKKRPYSPAKTSPKSAKSKKRMKRSKFHRYSSPSVNDSSTSTSSSSSSSESESSASEALTNSNLSDTASQNKLPTEVVNFTTEVVFSGLSKSTRKNVLQETPVPFHADLQPKQVDSFIKKYLKRKGTNFNPLMNRRQLNLAGRVLDPLGPLCNLWALAITADDEQCEIPPAVVIDMVKRAISLVGNASFCATSDRRKGLLAKLTPECLDLLDDKALFTRGHADLFGKKFKKNLLKDLKLSKEIDNLMPRKRASFTQMTRRFQPNQPFRSQPGKGPGFRSNTNNPFKRWEIKPRKFPFQQKQNPNN